MDLQTLMIGFGADRKYCHQQAPIVGYGTYKQQCYLLASLIDRSADKRHCERDKCNSLCLMNKWVDLTGCWLEENKYVKGELSHRFYHK